MLSLRHGHYRILLVAIGRAHVMLSGALDEPQYLQSEHHSRGGHSSLQILQFVLVVLNLGEHPHYRVI